MPATPVQKGEISLEAYLDREAHEEIRHEYLAGEVVAMGGASRNHGLIAGALFALLHPHARARGCQLFIADMKVRVDHQGETFFYYPDLVLTCDPSDRETLYCSSPCLIVEVLSPATERIDRREKRLAYGLLPSLQHYVLVDQDRLWVESYRRGNDGWMRETLTEGTLPVGCLDVKISLDQIYADIAQTG